MGHLVVELILAVILAVFGLISTILISAAGKVVADDFKDLAPRLILWLIDRAIARLPVDQREKYKEEWLSHILELPGNLPRICVAAHLSVAARKISAGTDLLEISPSKLTLKRVADIAIGGLLLVLLLPMMMLIAAAIILESKGPILRAVRITVVASSGKLKFRTTMIPVPGAEQRVTRVGRFLRQTSMDELPALFNVLAGSMSLVGNGSRIRFR